MTHRSIKFDRLLGILERAVGRVNWNQTAPEMVVSLDLVREEMDKRGWLDRWGTDVAVGARGVRFWDETARDQSACVMLEAGCFAFSDEGRFHTWAEIFGSAWLRSVQDTALGKAIEGIYFGHVNSRYWTRDAHNGVVSYTEGTLVRLLKAKGLSTAVPKGADGLSEIDRALNLIATQNVIHGAVPALFNKDLIVEYNGKRFVNTSSAKLMLPADGDHAVYGDGWPWLGRYFHCLLGEEQTEVLLAWLAHFYQGARVGDPPRGKGMFIAGPVGMGKSFLNNAVLDYIFGIAADASDYLSGDDSFNRSHFESAVWLVDDAKGKSTPRAKDRYTSIVKKVIANDAFTMRGMYQEAVRFPWRGRVLVLMNDDPASLEMLPATDTNIMDKVIFLHARDTSSLGDFPSNDMIRPELPHLCAYLDQMKPDGRIWVPGSRFGLAEYHDPLLKQEAEMSDATYEAGEVFEMAMKEWFSQEANGRGKAFVEVTPGELMQMLNGMTSMDATVRSTFRSVAWLGRYLKSLANRDGWKDWIELVPVYNSKRKYRIHNPNKRKGLS